MRAPEDLQSAYLLHSRQYRESSLIVNLFCAEYGVIPAVARGVRGGKSNHKRALLQPFRPLLCRWRGKGELVTLTDIDQGQKAPELTGNALYCGLYLNELLMRLIHRHDPHESLFYHYHKLIYELSSSKNIEQLLRVFEFNLLDELGYGLSFEYDLEGESINPERSYYLTTDSQFHEVLIEKNQSETANYFPGRILLAMAEQNWHDREVLSYAKQLSRLALQPLLGSKPLQSRKLFRSIKHDS